MAWWFGRLFYSPCWSVLQQNIESLAALVVLVCITARPFTPYRWDKHGESVCIFTFFVHWSRQIVFLHFLLSTILPAQWLQKPATEPTAGCDLSKITVYGEVCVLWRPSCCLRGGWISVDIYWQQRFSPETSAIYTGPFASSWLSLPAADVLPATSSFAFAHSTPPQHTCYKSMCCFCSWHCWPYLPIVYLC